MTKTLLSIAFAVEWDEDDLADLVRAVEVGIRRGIDGALEGWDAETADAAVELIEFYGVTVSLQRNLLEDD